MKTEKDTLASKLEELKEAFEALGHAILKETLASVRLARRWVRGVNGKLADRKKP